MYSEVRKDSQNIRIAWKRVDVIFLYCHYGEFSLLIEEDSYFCFPGSFCKVRVSLNMSLTVFFSTCFLEVRWIVFFNDKYWGLAVSQNMSTTPSTYNHLINFLQSELGIPPSSITTALRHPEHSPSLLPMILWQYGLVTLEQLEKIFDWQEIANQNYSLSCTLWKKVARRQN